VPLSKKAFSFTAWRARRLRRNRRLEVCLPYTATATIVGSLLHHCCAYQPSAMDVVLARRARSSAATLDLAAHREGPVSARPILLFDWRPSCRPDLRFPKASRAAAVRMAAGHRALRGAQRP